MSKTAIGLYLWRQSSSDIREIYERYTRDIQEIYERYTRDIRRNLQDHKTAHCEANMYLKKVKMSPHTA